MFVNRSVFLLYRTKTERQYSSVDKFTLFAIYSVFPYYLVINQRRFYVMSESLTKALGSFRSSGACYLRTEPAIEDALIQDVFAGFRRLVTEIELGNISYNDWCIDEHSTGDPDLGIIEKQGGVKEGGGFYDHKFFFHWSPTLIRHLPQQCVDQFGRWLQSCEALFELCCLNVNRFATVLDPELGALMNQQAAIDISRLRLLMYVKERDGKVASDHTDKDGITMHVAETAPGVVLGSQQAPEVAPVGKSLIFAGDKLERFTGGSIKAVQHHAVNHSKDGERRVAAVYFGHFVE